MPARAAPTPFPCSGYTTGWCPRRPPTWPNAPGPAAFVLVAGMGAAGVLCFVGMMIAVGVGVKNKPTSQIICGSGIRTARNTAKQLDASLRKGGLGTGTNPAA